MITVNSAFRWLNWENASHLTESSKFSVWQINDANLPDGERNAVIESLVHCSYDLPDPLERAEILANCAKTRYERGAFEEARRLCLDALQIYGDQREKDLHRQGVLGWMLHIVQRNLMEHGYAFANARTARKYFKEQAIHYLQLNDANKVNWYNERIQDMSCDLIVYPEEAFEWHNEFEGSHLNAMALELREQIRSLINNRNYPAAYQRMEILRQITHGLDSRETSEALAFCGLALCQMGNDPLAIQQLRLALANGIQSSHEYNCIRWMMGLVQTRMPAERAKGITNLETSLRNFQELKIKADHSNKPEWCGWYERQIAAMQRVLREVGREV